MDPSAIVQRLGVRRRAAGSDAERRAALAAADELRALGYRPRIETVWVRPHDGLVHALHCAVGLAASLTMTGSAVVGAALAGAALVLTLGELTGAARLTRALTPRRATQNVVAEDPRHPGSELTGAGGFGAGGPAAEGQPPVRLLLTATLDAARAGALSRGLTRRLWGRARRVLGGHLPGPHAVLAASLAALTAFGVARVAGADAQWMGPGQLPFSLALLLLGAAWVDLWLSEPAVGAVDATAPAAALAVAGALRTRPPRRLAVDVVLAGAGDGPSLGMRAFVAARSRRVRADELAVLHLEPCAAGAPGWIEREGRLVPLRFHPQLRGLATATARDEAHLRATARVSRGESGALVVRRRGWPALALGCLDGDGHPGAAVDRDALRSGIELALGVVARLDADLAGHPAPGPR